MTMVRRCEHCGADLAGEYCHQCGQRAFDSGDLTIAHVVRTAADDVLHFESKTLRSMALLFRPGVLTDAYLAGHRVVYTSPIKLYLASAAIFFLLAPFAGISAEGLTRADPTGAAAGLIAKYAAASGLSERHFIERFELRLQTVYTVSLALSVLAGAAMLSLLFRSQRRPFGAHVIFELHYVSFLYFVTIGLGVALRFAPRGDYAGAVLLFAVLAPYLFAALRRVYRERPRTILWKTAAMLLFALIADSIVNLLALVVTLQLA